MEEDRELAEPEAKRIKASVAYRKALLHGVLTAAQATTLLQTSTADVLRRMAHPARPGVCDAGEWRFPAAQFEHGQDVAGLAEVLKILTDSNVTALQQLSWLVEPIQLLDHHPSKHSAPEISRVSLRAREQPMTLDCAGRDIPHI